MGRVLRTEIQQKRRKNEREARVIGVRKTALNTSNMSDCRLVSPDKPLTEKQLRFAAAIAEGENNYAALVKAGFGETNPTYGSRLMAMPNIQREVKRLQELNAEAAQLSRIDVMNMHKEAYDMAKLMSDPSSMVAAAREIGKMCGYYEPRKIEVTLAGRKKLEQLTDEELQAAIAEEMARAQSALPA